MYYVESPENFEHTPKYQSIFLAGGITGCPNWQQEIVHLLWDTDLVVLNPRRTVFPIHNPDVAEEQITWEYRHLREANAILFWFPCETLCPIVLYELGAWSMTTKPIYVGVHPEYQRRRDVEIQMSLVRPEVEVVYSVQRLIEQVKASQTFL
jgi:hypothetical protein